jgi:hypothetical protein
VLQASAEARWPVLANEPCVWAVFGSSGQSPSRLRSHVVNGRGLQLCGSDDGQTRGARPSMIAGLERFQIRRNLKPL